MKQLLIVDDKRNLLNLTKAYLEKENKELVVTTMTSAAKALEIIKKEKFDAVISDFQISDMNGFELFKIVRMINSSLPFILIIDADNNEVILKALNLGITSVLLKSSNFKENFSKINNVLNELKMRKYTIKELDSIRTQNQRLLEEIQVLSENLAKERKDSAELLNLNKKQAVELKISEAKLDNLLENSPIGVLFFDLDKKERLVLQKANSFANGFFNIDHSQFIGKTFSKIYPPLIETELPEIAKGIALNGGEWENRNFTYEEGRELKTLVIRVFQLIPESIVIIFRDITKQMKLESDEQQLLHDLTFLSKTALDLVSFTKEQKIFRYFGEKLQEITGESIISVASYNESTDSFTNEYIYGLGKRIITVTKLLGKNPIGMIINFEEDTIGAIKGGKLVKADQDLAFISDEGLPVRVKKYMKNLLSINETYVIGFVYQEKILGISIISRKHQNGILNVKLIEAFANQISVALLRSNAEKELHKSEYLYESLIDNMNDGLAIDNPDGKLVYVNNMFCEMLGFSKEELLGKSVIEVLDPESAELYQKQTNRRKTGVVETYDMNWIKKDGVKILARIKPQPLYDENKIYEGSFAVITDITKITEVQESISKNQIELKQQRDELESFASTIAHDFRGRLQIITGLVDMEESDYSDMIIDQIDDFTEFINNLLLLAKKGDILGDITTIELTEIVENLTTYIATVKKNLKFKIGDLPKIKGDPTTLKQVFENIFMNIVKHSNATKVTINYKEDEKEKIIEIQDNGIGISKEKLEEIRQSWITRKYRSFGLLIVLKIMEAHNGRITLDSEIGKGTKTTLYFPKENLTN